MAESKIKAELVRLANSPMMENISKQLSAYEKKVKRLVNDFDNRSRDARDRSRRHLDNLADQLRKTRGDVEKKISTLWKSEGHRLNKSVNDLVTYLKSMAKKENAGRTAGTKSTKAGKKRAKSAVGTAKLRTKKTKAAAHTSA